MGQLIRIREMEQRLTSSLEAVRQMEEALDRYQAAQADITILATYLNSDEWRQDLADDERGLFPPNLKRGVLSEDAIWNLLENNRELLEQMQNLATHLLQKSL